MFKKAEDLFDELRKSHLQAERHFFSLLAPSKAHHAAEGKWQPLADVYETDEAWVRNLEREIARVCRVESADEVFQLALTDSAGEAKTSTGHAKGSS